MLNFTLLTIGRGIVNIIPFIAALTSRRIITATFLTFDVHMSAENLALVVIVDEVAWYTLGTTSVITLDAMVHVTFSTF